MYSCVKVLTPSGGTAPFTETISNINDATTGTPFAVRTMILLGGNTVAPNTLTYHGMASSNYAGDSSFHWDMGTMHDASGGSFGGGACFDFAFKVISGAGGPGYPFMDTWPDIFFGGYIGGLGTVLNITAGTFDIRWDRRDRSGDSKIVLCVGGSDYGVHYVAGAATGTVGPPTNILPAKPQGLLQFPSFMGTLASPSSATGAGGTSYNLGWDTRDSVRGATLNGTYSATNPREHWNNRFNPFGATVTAWTDTSYTIAGGDGGQGTQMVWCGADVVVKAGRFNCPATDITHSFNMGLNAKFVIVQTVGRTTAQAGTLDDVESEGSIGWVDPALSQGSFWAGDTTVGQFGALKGARYLSNAAVVRTGYADAVNTTFGNIGTVTALDSTGDITFSFASTDGTTPEILWFAVGLVAAEQADVEVIKVWDTEEGQTTLQIGTTPGGSEAYSMITGEDGTLPLSFTTTLAAGTYYVSETGGIRYFTPTIVATINGVDTTLGSDGAFTVANDDIVTITVTNIYAGAGNRPNQWKLYSFSMKLNPQERG